jgi:hypothetical protein
MTSSDIYFLAQPVIGFGALALGGALFLRFAIWQSDKRKAKRRERRQSSVVMVDETIESIQLKSNRGVYVFGLTESRPREHEAAGAFTPGTDRRS